MTSIFFHQHFPIFINLYSTGTLTTYNIFSLQLASGLYFVPKIIPKEEKMFDSITLFSIEHDFIYLYSNFVYFSI